MVCMQNKQSLLKNGINVGYIVFALMQHCKILGQVVCGWRNISLIETCQTMAPKTIIVDSDIKSHAPWNNFEQMHVWALVKAAECRPV